MTAFALDEALATVDLIAERRAMTPAPPDDARFASDEDYDDAA